MSLITCPECGREISNTASSCPQCGYVLVLVDELRRKTELSEIVRKKGLGTTLIVLGIVMILPSVLLIATIIGIFSLIGCIMAIVAGTQMLKGEQKGNCPYCGTDVIVPTGNKTYKCSACKKVSTQTPTELIAIE